MHPTARKNAIAFVDKYLADQSGLDVLDVGGANVNGSLAEVFIRHNYIALDVREAEGVDIVVEQGKPYPMAKSSFDVIVSTSMMEHDQAFWVTFNEMVRVCKPNGLIYICVPSRGNHHWETDCWRFLADAFPALEKWNGCVELLETYIDENGFWGDNIGIFRKFDVL